MMIYITSGIGSAPTQLGAFDAALWDAGIANYNLIKLSSIVPRGTKIVSKRLSQNGNKDFGNKLYLVLAEKLETERGRDAWAGIGWVQSKDGKGLFVEHHGSKKEEVVNLIDLTLESMARYRKEKFGKIHRRLVGIRCKSEPVCAVVAAVYKSEDWQ